jgi:hypothetical protein
LSLTAQRPSVRDWLLLGVLALLAAAIRLSIGPLPVDDAYISFRYARNLGSGLGLVYNPGETVFGTSTPLYTLLLSGASTLLPKVDLAFLALWLNSIADALTTVLLVGIGRRLGMTRGIATIAGVAFALSPVVIRYSIGGLELSVVTLLALAAFLAYIAGRRALAAHLAGAAFLGRPDALLVGAVVILVATSLARRPDYQTGAILSLWVLPMVLTLWISTGLPLPHSAVAKSHPVYMIQPLTNLRQALLFFSGLFAAGPLGLGAEGFWTNPSPLAALLTTLVLLPQSYLWFEGAKSAGRAESRALVLPVYAALLVLIYATLGLRGSAVAEWYFLPILPISILLVLRGAESLRSSAAGSRLPLALGVLLIVCQIAGLNLGRDPRKALLLPLAAWSEREQLYREAAAILRPRLAPDDRVAASEIGALGFYCECRVLDTVGLVSPSALHYYPLPDEAYAGNYAIPPGLIRDQQPEYLVSLEIMLRNTLMQDEWFLSNYRQIWYGATDAFGSRGLLVFARQDLE